MSRAVIGRIDGRLRPQVGDPRVRVVEVAEHELVAQVRVERRVGQVLDRS